MTPLDEAPEQRWRRTVDRRSRPAKLKVDRLLRDFGYAELDAAVGDAIEARLAGVALAVTPSLRDAAVGEVVTIYAHEAVIEPLAPAPAPPEAGRAPDPEPKPKPKPKPRPRAKAAPAPAPAPEPAVATDIAQMVTYLKQEVLDARLESERLRKELDGHIAARTDAQTDAQAIIAEQAAALEEQSRQIAELGAALDHSRQALGETREEIRRAVGELQALPEPELFPELVEQDDDPVDGLELGDEASYGDPDAADDDAWPPLIAVADAPAITEVEPLADASAEAEAPAIADAGPAVEEPALGVGDAAAQLEEPALPADEPVLAHDEPVTEFGAPVAGEPVTEFVPPAPDVDEPPLERDGPAGEPTELGDPTELVEPADTGEPATVGEAADHAAPAAAEEPALPFDPPEPAAPGEPESWVPAQLREPEPDDSARGDFAQTDAPAPEPEARRRTADLGDPPPPAGEFAAAAADGPVDDREPPIDDDVVADFDDFLYDPDELYDPDAPAIGDEPSEGSEAAEPWLDQPASALPPPPPPPPSPWAGEPGGEPEAQAPHDRPARGKVLRGRGGRGRGRWQGRCSICGRLPLDNKRKDLEAAGWDLDDEAAACPQCRGIA